MKVSSVVDRFGVVVVFALEEIHPLFTASSLPSLEKIVLRTFARISQSAGFVGRSETTCFARAMCCQVSGYLNEGILWSCMWKKGEEHCRKCKPYPYQKTAALLREKLTISRKGFYLVTQDAIVHNETHKTLDKRRRMKSPTAEVFTTGRVSTPKNVSRVRENCRLQGITWYFMTFHDAFM